jgi:hypothetical protein
MCPSDMLQSEELLEPAAIQMLEYLDMESLLDGFEHYTTGSLALDTMAWPDIDINIHFEQDLRPLVYRLASACLNLSPSWIELRCTEGEAESPGHFFLGFEVARGELLWNFDLWFLGEEEFNESFDWLAKMKRTLNPSLRRSSIDLRLFLMELGEYPKKISSMDVYNAVLDEGISTRNDFQTWYERRHTT